MNRGCLACGWWLLSTASLFGQGAEVFAPPESLVVEGVPPIPSALAEKASRYTEFRSADLLDWHPASRELLIGTRFADTNQVHHVANPGGDRRQITFFPDRVLDASFHPHKGDYFILTKDIGGNEFYQFYRYRLAEGDATLLTDGKSRNTGAVWSNAGDKIAYGSTRRNRSDVDFYVMDPAQPQDDKRLVENQGGGWRVADWSSDDKQLLVSELISINESYVWLIDLANGQKTLVTPKISMEKIAYHPVAFSKDGKGIYELTDRDSEFMRLAYLDLRSAEHTFLAADIPWDVESARLSLDGKRIAFATNENGISRLHLLDTATKEQMSVPKLPEGVISHLQWHENNRDLGFVITSARSTADVYSIDTTSGQVDRWTNSETGGLDPQSFLEPRLITWKTFDGREISGFLYRPPARFNGKRPVIVNIHGGPEGQSRPIFLGRNNYFLNELGVALIFPNIRGSSGYGKSFLKLDDGFLREDSYKDIGALFDWMATSDDFDESRVMVTGGSYGGHMTLAVATRYNDRIRCSLDVVGISNLVTFLQRTEGYRRDLRRVEYGDERDPKMRAYLEKIAPLNHAGAIKKPLFVVQGKNDPRVPLSESEQMIATVRKNQTPVWYTVAQDEGHGFVKKKNADFQFYATILFVRTCGFSGDLTVRLDERRVFANLRSVHYTQKPRESRKSLGSWLQKVRKSK
ncbi:MAG: S9 family peptidase [Planctomycetia bacterium]|nr:S9 family peptidase [Planctomycetia bacterium]